MITHSCNSLDSFDTDYITSKVSGSDAVAARLAGRYQRLYELIGHSAHPLAVDEESLVIASEAYAIAS